MENQDTSTEQATPQATRMEEFKKTARAARLSGTFNKTVGSIKHSVGKLMDDETLKNAGRNQEVLGKLHKFVGAVREVKETAQSRVREKKTQSAAILRTHGGKMLDVATDCVRDLKKLFLK